MVREERVVELCGIPNIGLFQNGGGGWEESYGHGICGKGGARNAR